MPLKTDARPGMKIAVVAVMLAGVAFAPESAACPSQRTEMVTVEEFIGDSLADVTEELIARGRKEAVQQAAIAHVRVSSSERVDNDTLVFKSVAKERFRGSVLSHTVISRSAGRIGDRDTLKFNLRVVVCVQPEDQVWYVVQAPFSSDRGSRPGNMRDVVKSPSRQIQVVQPGGPGADDASYILRGAVFSEKQRIDDWTNDGERYKHSKCVADARRSQQMMSGLLGSLTGRRLNIGSGGHNCGPSPPRRTGKMLSMRAVFVTKVCDIHMDTCAEHRQPHRHSQRIASRVDIDAAKAAFYRDGFGLSSSISLAKLMNDLGVKGAALSNSNRAASRRADTGSARRSRGAFPNHQNDRNEP